LWLNTRAQSSGSIQQYYYLLSDKTVVFAPIASYQFDNSLYFEGRYNYEEMNTFSAYIGKTFENNSAFKYSFSPIAGGVFGTYKGASLGANVSFEYKNLYFSSQPQYTFTFNKTKEDNFIYSWSELSYQIKGWLAAGISAQHTKLYQAKGLVEKGLLLSFSYKKWSLPLYIFNPESKENKYFLIGLNFEWEGKKKKKIQEPSIPAPIDSSVHILAGLKKKDDLKTTSNPVIEGKKVNVIENTEVNLPVSRFKIDPGYEDGLLALVLGPFNSKTDALTVHSKLVEIYGPQAVLYEESEKFKIRIMGFAGKKELDGYVTKSSAEDRKRVLSVMPYQIKNVDVYTVK